MMSRSTHFHYINIRVDGSLNKNHSPSGHIFCKQAAGGWKHCEWRSCRSHLHPLWGDTCPETEGAACFHGTRLYTTVGKYNTIQKKKNYSLVRLTIGSFSLFKETDFPSTWWYFFRILCISATSSLVMILMTYLLLYEVWKRAPLRPWASLGIGALRVREFCHGRKEHWRISHCQACTKQLQ